MLNPTTCYTTRSVQVRITFAGPATIPERFLVAVVAVLAEAQSSGRGVEVVFGSRPWDFGSLERFRVGSRL